MVHANSLKLAVCVFCFLVFPTASSADDAGLLLPPNEQTDPGLGYLTNRYVQDRRAIEFKYREPLSPIRHQRMNELYRVYQAELKAIDPATLSQTGIVDYTLLKNEIDFRSEMAKIEAAKDQQALGIVASIAQLIALLEQHEMTHQCEPKTVAALFVKAAEDIEKDNARLRRDGPGEQRGSNSHAGEQLATALRASEAVASLQRRLIAFHKFYSGYDPLYSWWCKEPYESLDKSVATLRNTLRVAAGEDNPNSILGQPIGEAAMQLELAHEMIPYSPAELIEIAEREFAWCDAEMLKASGELGFGDDWQAAMEAVKERHVPPGQQTKMIRELALEAIEFLKSRNLVTVPPLCEEIWRMEMMSPERQRVNPFFLGGDTIIVSYPTDTMTHAEKLMSMRGNNEHFARATVHHELIPGHHLQGFMNDRYRTYRQVFSTPFWIEGWALYWEMMLWDKGFARSPEDKIGMLFWRKHRCARIVFSLGYQLGRMTPQQCVDYLVERVGHERLNAEAEVRRSIMGGYGALYQAAYMLGGLQIRALREELVDTGKISEVDFHDAILKEGSIPITMVRAILVGERPNPDNPNTWKFAGQ